MASFPQLFRDSLSLLEGNLSTSITGSVNDFLRQQGLNLNQVWRPSVDLVETESEITLYFDIPGVKPDSIDVDFFNNCISLKGERECLEVAESDCITRRREIVYGKFERKVTLPISVTNRDSVQINIGNGVLIVSINKINEVKNSFSLRLTTPDEK